MCSNPVQDYCVATHTHAHTYTHACTHTYTHLVPKTAHNCDNEARASYLTSLWLAPTEFLVSSQILLPPEASSTNTPNGSLLEFFACSTHFLHKVTSSTPSLHRTTHSFLSCTTRPSHTFTYSCTQ